jgi:hypothetical protein
MRFCSSPGNGEVEEGIAVDCSADVRGKTRSPGCDEAVSTLIEDTASSGESGDSITLGMRSE